MLGGALFMETNFDKFPDIRITCWSKYCPGPYLIMIA